MVVKILPFINILPQAQINSNVLHIINIVNIVSFFLPRSSKRHSFIIVYIIDNANYTLN